MSSGAAFLLIVLAALIAITVGVSVYIYYGRLFMRTRLLGVPVPLKRIIGLSFKRLNAYAIVTAYADAHLAGVDIPFDALEQHALDGGRVRPVVDAVIAAHNAGIELSLAEARSLDLQGKDPMEGLQRKA